MPANANRRRDLWDHLVRSGLSPHPDAVAKSRQHPDWPICEKKKPSCGWPVDPATVAVMGRPIHIGCADKTLNPRVRYLSPKPKPSRNVVAESPSVALVMAVALLACTGWCGGGWVRRGRASRDTDTARPSPPARRGPVVAW